MNSHDAKIANAAQKKAYKNTAFSLTNSHAIKL
jgi:hypothetical protein